MDEESVAFAGGNCYPVVRGTPILIDEGSSLFSIADVVANAPTTQARSYRSRKSLKNYVRQRLLPALSVDGKSHARYAELAAKIDPGPVLVIGAGDKAERYRQCFPNSPVVITDVHTQFGVDLVLDAHGIPFDDETFSLVLAPQVLEHVSRPWIVASEIQRVTRRQGYIQIEVPFAFPVHGAPYDFYRFTPSALRFLFAKCELAKLHVPEGNWSGAAVAGSHALVDSFSNRYLRMLALATSRGLLWWMKYLDRWAAGGLLGMPKGYAATFLFDGEPRDEQRLLKELEALGK